MRRLRYCLCAAFFFLYGAFALPFAPVILVLPPKWVRFAVRMFYIGFVKLARLCRLYRVEADSATLAALRNCRGRIVAMNHVSLIDICIILAHLSDSTAIAKAAALKNPVLAAEVKKMFIVNDEDPGTILAKARELLEMGLNIVIFPQGTRGGKKLHRGAARLALELKTEILPVKIAYDPVVLGKHQPWYYVGEREIKIYLKAENPIVPQGESNYRNARELTGIIAERLNLAEQP